MPENNQGQFCALHENTCENIAIVTADLKQKASMKLIFWLFGVTITSALIFFGGSFKTLYDQGEDGRMAIKASTDKLTKEMSETKEDLTMGMHRIQTGQEVLKSRFEDWIEAAPPAHHHNDGGTVIRDN